MTERKIFTKVVNGETVKVSKVQIFKEMLEEQVVKDTPLYKELVEHEIDLLSRKSQSRASGKTSEEDIALKAKILEVLDGKARATDIFGKLIAKGVAVSSPQKVTSLLGKLVDDGAVERTVDKRITYFSKVEG